MERSQMDAILNEQGFQQSGACDGQECAVQIGKLLGIDRIVVGSVAAFGKAYTIAVREVDVKTGEVLVTASRNWKGDFENLLTDIVPMVAKELAHPEVPKQLVEKTAPPVVPPPPSVAVSTPTTSEKPVSVESKQSSGSWKWWLTGGVLVASGTTAAILLLNNDSKTSTSTTQNSDVTVRWAQ
jgi:hypothetical protein